MQAQARPRARIGELLVRAGIATPWQVEQAVSHKVAGRTLGEQLVADGAVTEADVAAALAFQLDVPLVFLDRYPVDELALPLVPGEFAREHRALLLESRDDQLLVAMSDPADTATRAALAERTGRIITPVLALPTELDREIVSRYGLPAQAPSSEPLAAPAAEPVVAPGASVPHAPSAAPAVVDWQPVQLPVGEPATVSAPAETESRPPASEPTPIPLRAAQPEEERPRPRLVELDSEVAAEEASKESAPGGGGLRERSEPEPPAPASRTQPRQLRAVEEPAPERRAPSRVGAAALEGQIVDFILAQALRDHATDVHVEPLEDRLRVRFRVDGALHEVTQLPRQLAEAIASRLRALADMERDERSEGQITLRDDGREATFQIATAQTVWGEKVVLRLIERSTAAPELAELGMESGSLERWRELLKSPYGMALVCGPAGAGKTTTLYASLREFDSAASNLTTVEDPVEQPLQGVNQLPVDRSSGESFADAVRTAEKQDPDVLMIGELRDAETAEVAVNAALGGRFVLSGLQASDGIGGIYRLLSLGVDAYLASTSLVAVLAQMLVRRLCVHCRTTVKPQILEAALLRQAGLPDDRVWIARGCSRCSGTGYRGRVGVFELLIPSDELRASIARSAAVDEAREIAARTGLVTLRDAALRLVADGTTSAQEVVSRLRSA